MSWSPTTGVTVGDRATKPTDQSAPGIQVRPPNRIPIVIGNTSYEIAANDWNTIVARSHVPRRTVVDIDPAFAASPTTRARFQYLADVITKHAGNEFNVVNVGISPNENSAQIVTVAALVNPTPSAVKLIRLHLTVLVGLPYKRVTSGTFYAAPGSHLTIGAETVSFIRLISRAVAHPVGAHTSDRYRYTTIVCKTVAC